MNSLEWITLITGTFLVLLYCSSEYVYRKTNQQKLSQVLDSALEYTVGIFVILMIILVSIQWSVN